MTPGGLHIIRRGAWDLFRGSRGGATFKRSGCPSLLPSIERHCRAPTTWTATVKSHCPVARRRRCEGLPLCAAHRRRAVVHETATQHAAGAKAAPARAMAALAGREDPLSFEALGQLAARRSKGNDPLLAELGVLEELQSLRLKGAATRLVEAEKRKARGNAAFTTGETDKAMRAYLEALWLLRPLPAFDSMPPCDRSLPCGSEAAAFLGERADGLSPKHKLLRSLHGNVCACALKREDWALAVLSAEHVLTAKTCPTKEWRLAVRRRAKAVNERGVGEVEWTQKAPPVPAPVEPAKRSKLASGFFSSTSKTSKLGETREPTPKRRPRNPVQEEEMERDEALHDYARRVASGHAYKPGEHPEDGKEVAF